MAARQDACDWWRARSAGLCQAVPWCGQRSSDFFYMGARNMLSQKQPKRISIAGWAIVVRAVALVLLAPLTLATTARTTPGEVLSHQKISDTQGGFTGTLGNGDEFGASVASLGDLDGNGVGDLAPGQPLIGRCGQLELRLSYLARRFDLHYVASQARLGKVLSCNSYRVAERCSCWCVAWSRR